MLTDDLLQPFPAKFASPDGDANIFVVATEEIIPHQSVSMHRHDFYELVWLRQGHCTFFNDFQLYPIEKGCLLFISPGQLHEYFVEEGTIRLYIIGFRPTILPIVAHNLLYILPFDDTYRNPTIAIPASIQESIEHLFAATYSRFDTRAFGWEAIVTTYLQTILTEAAYLMPEEFTLQTANASVKLTRAFQRAVEKHYRKLRQVHEYADLLGVTSNYLVKAVREITSTTPKQMLQDRLLIEAKRILAHTPYPVNKISDLLEFPDHTTFARWFKKLTAQTPSEFRNQYLLA